MQETLQDSRCPGAPLVASLVSVSPTLLRNYPQAFAQNRFEQALEQCRLHVLDQARLQVGALSE